MKNIKVFALFLLALASGSLAQDKELFCPPGTERSCLLDDNGNAITCECVPSQPVCVQTSCRNRYVWLQEMCECVCPPMYCEEGTVHGSDCDCVPACPGLECYGGNVPNYDGCYCECPLSEAECPGPLGYLDYDFCECRRHPCDPPWPCPEGEIIDWNICNCAPDPNYSSTTLGTTAKPKCSSSSSSKSRSSRKSSSRSRRSSSSESRSRSNDKKKVEKAKPSKSESNGKKK